MTYDNITVSAGELKWALRKHLTATRPVSFGGYYSFDNLINEGVSEVLRKRDRDERAVHQKSVITDEPPVRIDETFTAAELIRALELIGYGQHGRANVESWVRTIKESVREQQWYPGDVVRDATGAFWRRITGTHPWVQFGSQAKFRHESPVRPLKKVEV